MAPLPDDHRAIYQAFLDQAALDASLTPWLAKLPEQLAHGLDRNRHGDLSVAGADISGDRDLAGANSGDHGGRHIDACHFQSDA